MLFWLFWKVIVKLILKTDLGFTFGGGSERRSVGLFCC